MPKKKVKSRREPIPPFTRTDGLGDGWVCEVCREALLSVHDALGVPWLLHEHLVEGWLA